jgi:tetratricopeptide (TPR) repeat protein
MSSGTDGSDRPLSAEEYFNRGVRLFSVGRWEEAIRDWTATIERNPLDAEAHLNRGAAFERLAEYQKALEDYDTAVSLDPWCTMPKLNRAKALLIMGEVERAIDAYSDVIEQAPRTPLLYIYRSEAHLARDDYKSAIEDLNQARRLGYCTAELEVERGWLYQVLKQPERVVSALMDAIQLDPSNAYALGLCGHNLIKLGQLEFARRLLEKSLQLDPLNPGPHVSLAGVLTAAGAAADAQIHLEKAETLRRARRTPSTPRCLESLSRGDQKTIEILDRMDRQLLGLRAKYSPPFTRFSGVGRRISTQLSPLQSVAMSFAFPVFSGRSTIDRAGARPPEWLPSWVTFADRSVQRKIKGRRFARRRYSGDTHAELPRSRYLALAGPRSAPASYTLLAEMNAYAVPLKTGYAAGALAADGESLRLIFRGLPGEPNPLRHLIVEPERFSFLFDEAPNDPRGFITAQMIDEVPANSTFEIPLPCEDVEIHLDNAFDLRLPDTRRWMVEFFRNPPSANADEDLAHGDWLALTAEQYRYDLGAVHDWRGLLPATNTATFGGNAMTDVFAQFLRKLGCEGLIFPSARCDHGVVVDDGAPKYDWGWNLVDYRGAPISDSLSPEEISPLEPLEGILHYAELLDGVNAGSFAFLGNTLRACISNQLLYDRYCIIRAPAWRMANGGDELSVRGYTWFRRKFSHGLIPAEVVQCDRCQTEVPKQSAFVPRCPACQFSGDMGVFVEVPNLFLQELQPL